MRQPLYTRNGGGIRGWRNRMICLTPSPSITCRLVMPLGSSSKYSARGIANQVIEPVEGDLDDVVPGVVVDSQERQPLRLDLSAESQRGHLDLLPLPEKATRCARAEISHSSLSILRMAT